MRFLAHSESPMNQFHVLVVDDSRELIQKLGSRISPQHTIAGTHWRVVFHGVHIQAIHDRDQVRFSDDTLRALVAACRNQPNLIVADYGYPSPEQAKQLFSGELTPVQYLDRILSAPNLVPAVKAFLEREHPTDKQLAAQIQSSLCDNPCRLYLYTYTPLKFQDALPTVDARSKLTQRVFHRSEVIPVDISLEIYENGIFDVDEPTDQDKRFRAYLTTGLLDQIIHRELLSFVLARETERLRFVRYYRSGAGVFVIVLLGGAIGAVGEWLGERIMALIMAGFGTTALVLGVLAGVAFFILGLGVPLFFERLMSNLLRKLKSDEPGNA